MIMDSRALHQNNLKCRNKNALAKIKQSSKNNKTALR